MCLVCIQGLWWSGSDSSPSTWNPLQPAQPGVGPSPVQLCSTGFITNNQTNDESSSSPGQRKLFFCFCKSFFFESTVNMIKHVIRWSWTALGGGSTYVYVLPGNTYSRYSKLHVSMIWNTQVQTLDIFNLITGKRLWYIILNSFNEEFLNWLIDCDLSSLIWNHL